MSVQFGRCNLEGKPVDAAYLEEVKPILAPYGPDGGSSYSGTGISILYRAFHTTKASRRETQPHLTRSRAVITWDGRLDNREEIIRQLREAQPIGSPDVNIVGAAYDEWGTACFRDLIGDWALSIWDQESRTLFLAKDPIGFRHLFYSIDREGLTWSTVLEPLVLCSGQSLALDEEYLAGCLSSFPASHLTPYVGIHSVPPSSYISLCARGLTVSKYWDFHPGPSIRYRTDAEYEEHFRDVFAQAVLRRLRSDSPILAELSGGMDSSSIVCVADSIAARGIAEAPRIDTVSYYDDTEPDWNERPYFSMVEAQRGRTGLHIDVGGLKSFNLDFAPRRFAATPGSNVHPSAPFTSFLKSHGIRVLLSGLGGDEVTGGVPTPIPELCDLLATCQFAALARQLKAWALNKRQPWLCLLFDAVGAFLPLPRTKVQSNKNSRPWLNPAFVERNLDAIRGYQRAFEFFGPPPSFQNNLSTLDRLRRQIGCIAAATEPPYEKRYPYLDRSLLDFIFAIPREQMVRPGERRSLMRRALIGIVPGDVLNRKRKAFVSRAPMTAIATDWAELANMCEHLVSGSFGIIDARGLSDALTKVRHGHHGKIVLLMRAVGVELWLRNCAKIGILNRLEDLVPGEAGGTDEMISAENK